MNALCDDQTATAATGSNAVPSNTDAEENDMSQFLYQAGIVLAILLCLISF